MRWQRLLRSAAAVVGAAAGGCASAPALHASDLGVPPAALVRSAPEPGGARMQKSESDKAITPASLARSAEPPPNGQVVTQIRALVNGVPILDDEVREGALPQR